MLSNIHIKSDTIKYTILYKYKTDKQKIKKFVY